MNTSLPAKVLLCLALLLLAACAPVTPSQPALSTSVPPEPAAPFLPATTIADPPPLMEPSAALPAAPAALEPLYLRVLWPEEGSLITMPEIELVGEATPGAVVSIDDEIIIVPTEGAFRQVIRLEEGPNAIEIVASNAAGQEQALIFTIIYEP